MKNFLFILLFFYSVKSEISLIAVGDISIGVYGSTINDTILNPVKPFLKGDFVFGNLEGVFLDKQIKSTKMNKKNFYSFRLKESYATFLKDAGFNILNFNNNHSNDYGIIGKKNTQKILENNNIKCLIDSIVFNNVAFYSFYLHSNNCITWTDSINEIIKNLSKKRILIISIHGGQEGSTQIKDTCEKYLGEYRGNLYEFSHKSIDAGADVVLCHGPHVLREIEIYNNKLIAHSLGNFCTPFGFNINGKFGETEILKIILKDNGEFEKYELIKFKQVKNLGFISN